MSPTVSVVIPTYNRWHTLPRALESVLAQSRVPEEVVVVDDGSNDGTSDHLARDFPSVRVLTQPNRGVSAARNAAIAVARGEWIAFLDSDDEWRPEKVERQLAAIAREPDKNICHCDEVWIRNGKRVNPMDKHRKYGGWIFRRCLPLCAISPSAAVVRRDLLISSGGFDERLPACEDYDLWLRLCASHPVLFLDERLVVKYGGHEDQLSRRYWGMDRFRIDALSRILDAGLEPGDRRAAAQTLVEKIDVYLAGARKRRKNEEIEKYTALRERARRALV